MHAIWHEQNKNTNTRRTFQKKKTIVFLFADVRSWGVKQNLFKYLVNLFLVSFLKLSALTISFHKKKKTKQ